MSAEQLYHVAMPSLYGAPAYARPSVHVATSARPFDPDDLPIEAARSDEDLELLAHAGDTPAPAATAELPGRGFSVRSLTSRFLGLQD